MVGRIISVVLALGAMYLIFRVGVAMIRSMIRPLPEPPPPGELRRVKLLFRCPQCGMELRVTAAADEDPIPPRHCMDEMDLVATGND